MPIPRIHPLPAPAPLSSGPESVDSPYVTSIEAARRVRIALPAAGYSWQAAAAFAAAAAVVSAALFLRLYDLQPYAAVPDHYDRLTDAARIVSGRLPESRFYPPGAAFIFAIPVALGSDSMITLQVTTAIFGAALVALAYFGVAKLTGDRLAAVCTAALVAVHPLFVEYSRSGFTDIVQTFMTVLLVFLVPWLKGRPLPAFVAYGALFALLVLQRPTNLVVAAPLAVYWLSLNGTGVHPGRIVRALTAPHVLATAATAIGLCAVSVLAGNWSSGGYGNVITTENFAANVVYYARMTVGWSLGAVIVPLAAVGCRCLWRTDRGLLLAGAALLFVLPLTYAPFYFQNWRYMMPTIFVVLMLASLGISSLLTAGSETRLRRFGRVLAAGSMLLVMGSLTNAAGGVVGGWPEASRESDWGLAQEVVAYTRALPDEALLISPVTRTLGGEQDRLQMLDLMEVSAAERDPDRVRRIVLATIAGAAVQGRDVYYLYSHIEDYKRIFSRDWDDFQLYFRSIEDAYTVTEVFRTEARRFGKEDPWVLYRVTPKPEQQAPEPAAAAP